ncbi:hypothetical protein B0T18DRAFT_427904 [Schizothecium vesticola]|uniref:Uncharacterized protein n=1 Tax=Schizothecium vesticola TaxID=314040 RepID=A0AA40F256_9PEZI|nr:hypothetical protein B0T18DRAFT_427904 [Schizothecium vesticola]
MKFTIATVVAFAAMALASPAMIPVVKRQNAPAVDASVPAMTDRAGNVIPFDSTKVYQNLAANGL